MSEILRQEAGLGARAGGLTGEGWAHLAVTTLVWLVLPLVVSVGNLLRSEVK
jgi:ABC-2 type transport system permease protein